MKTLKHLSKDLLGSKAKLAGLLAASLLLGACSDNNSLSMATFEIEVTNLSAAQPLSPLAIVMHDNTWTAFDTGSPASESLEVLAEGGDNSGFLLDATEHSAVHATASGSGIVAPGASEVITIDVPVEALGTLSVSVVSMLVNTNDAIAALNNESLAALSLNDSMSFAALSYDSGTEANTETADTMPGPAASGGAQEGFNAARDDIRDAVYVHAGVVTQDDGLSSSALTEVHRWDHPAILIEVERSF